MTVADHAHGQRRGTASAWNSANPTLRAGELGIESDTGLVKIGDGSTQWIGLDYINGLEPIQAELNATYRQAIFPEAYGAEGDWNGTTGTNDLDAVQDALDAAAGGAGTVVLTRRYRCAGVLTVADGTHLHLEAGSELVRDHTGGTGITDSFIRNDDFTAANKVDGIRVTGEGTISYATGATGNVFGLYGDDLVLRDFTIDGWAGGRAFVIGGDRIRMSGGKAVGSATGIGQGGIRMIGGDDFVCTGWHVESGDDAFQFVPVGNPSDPLYDLSITRSHYIGCTGRSLSARLVAVGLIYLSSPGSMTASISDVSFRDVKGFGGDRGIFIANDASSGSIQRVLLDDVVVDQVDASSSADEVRLSTDGNYGDIDGVTFRNVSILNPQTTVFQRAGANVKRFRWDGGEIGVPDTLPSYVMALDSITDVKLRDLLLHSSGTTGGIIVGAGSATAYDVEIDGVEVREVPNGGYAINYNTVVRGHVRGTITEEASAATTAHAIRVGSSCSGIEVSRNDVSRLTATSGRINDLASDTVVVDNKGFVRRSSGQATITSASGLAYVTVTHGINGTPTPQQISLTAMTSLGSAAKVWTPTANINSTNFRIQLDAVPGADAVFGWSVDASRA